MKKKLVFLFFCLLSLNVGAQESAQVELNKKLVDAIRKDNLELVVNLVKQGADVNYRVEYTVLMFAVGNGNLKIVNFLVQSGADCNQEGLDDISENVLGTAVLARELKILKFLIDECGVNIDLRGAKSGRTALYKACLRGSTEAVEFLINRSADVDIPDINGVTPLMVIGENITKANLLIDHGANVNATSITGETALREAITFWRLEILEVLIKNGAKISKYESKKAFYKSIEYRNLKLIKLLIDNGADISTIISRDPSQTPLMFAMEKMDNEIVRLLIKSGEGLNTSTDEGLTALIQAIQQKDLYYIDLLIENGANVNMTDRYGTTPLVHAVLANELDIVKRLVVAKASINAVNYKGYSVIQLTNNKQIKDFLKANGGSEPASLKPILIPAIGHTAEVTVVAFSPDGQRILTGSKDRTAKLWDTKTGKLLHNFIGHKHVVRNCAFSPDGLQVYTEDGIQAKIWDVKSGVSIGNESYSEIIGLMKKGHQKLYSPNRQQRVEKSANTALLLDLKQEDTLHVLSGYTRPIKSAIFSPNRELVLLLSNSRASVFSIRSGKEIQHFYASLGTFVAPVFSSDNKYILTTNGANKAQIWDVKTGNIKQEFLGHKDTIVSAKFNYNGRQVITGSKDETAKVWDVNSGKKIHNFWGFQKSVNPTISPDGRYAVCCDSDGGQLWDMKRGELVRKFNDNYEMHSITFSPNGKKILSSGFAQELSYVSGELQFNSNNAIVQLLNIKKGKEEHTFVGYLGSFSPDGQVVVTAHRDYKNHTAMIWNAQTGSFIREVTGHLEFINSIKFSPDGEQFLTSSRDNTTKLWDVKTGRLVHDFIGHKASIYSATFSQNGQYIYTASEDNSLKIWNTKTGKLLLTFYQMDDNDWAVIHPSGLFDATPGAMKKMHYVVGLEPVELDQLKTVYHLPELWEMVMNTEELPKVKFDEFQMFPTAELSIKKEEPNILKIKLKKRDGGYGKVSVFIGRKRIIEDVLPKNIKQNRAEISIEVNLLEHAHLLYSDTMNKIRVLTFNREGYLRSQYFDINYQPIIPKGKKGKQFIIHPKSEKKFPNFYGVFVGISEYEGNKADLNYADEDAIALESVIHAAATELLVPVNKTVETKVLATAPNQQPPSKENIKKAILSHKDISTNDVFFLHLSGHGAVGSYMDNEIELHDFFFFTKEAKLATSEYLDNPQVRQDKAISSTELANWLNQIPAERIILIIDACYAGKGSQKIMLAMSKGISPKQRKALDRMKDNTGIFILAGSASSQVSWELPQYRHGILTYCLLDGLNGDALKDGEYLDVIKWFQYAIDRVPEISPEKQTPTFDKNYNASSFSIGKITKNVLNEINLAAPSIVMAAANFQDDNERYDVLKLSAKVSNYLENFSIKNGSIIYAPLNNTGYKISGGYVQANKQITVKFRLFKDDEPVCGFIEVKATEHDLAGKIVKRALEIIEDLKN